MQSPAAHDEQLSISSHMSSNTSRAIHSRAYVAKGHRRTRDFSDTAYKFRLLGTGTRQLARTDRPLCIRFAEADVQYARGLDFGGSSKARSEVRRRNEPPSRCGRTDAYTHKDVRYGDASS